VHRASGLFLDEPADAVAALAGALGAFDAQHVELALDVTEDEIGASHSESAYQVANQRSPRCEETADQLALLFHWISNRRGTLVTKRISVVG
jgi:hypothetical protein